MEKDYKNNAYYKCLFNALKDAFVANRIDLKKAMNRLASIIIEEMNKKVVSE